MKRLLSVILALTTVAAAVVIALPSAAAPSSPFDDVATSRWSFASIVYAVENNYMKGTGERKFSPSGTLTRAMVATVLWRRQGEPKPAKASGFSDVAEGQWYADAVAWAKETGVVMGVSETKFKPNDNVTREQLAAMLFRFSSSAPVSVPERADLGAFPDGAKVSGWADEAMAWAVEAALVKGKDDGRLDPGGFATREQFAAIIERFDNTFKLRYSAPVFRSQFVEADYPLVTDADFYVSTAGDDSADGSFEHPFRTFERARDAVRSLDRTGRTGITVAFMAGDYGPLNLSLTAEDSGTADCPITYCKYGDGDVTFDNGFEIGEDEFGPITEEDKSLFPDKAHDKIKRADISDRLAPGEYNYSFVLISSDRFYDPARYPNKYADGSEQLLRSVGEKVDDSTIRITNKILRSKLAKYHTYDDLRFAGTFAHTWFYGILDLRSYDPETGEASFYDVDKLTYGINAEHVYGFEVAVIGASEELDAQNEYWLDRETRTLYVYDPKSDFSMATRGDFFDIDKAAYLSFIGLDFKNTTGGVAFIDSHDITFDRCSVIGAGDNLFAVPNNGIYNFKLINSEIGQIAAGVGRFDDSTPRENDADYSSCGIVFDNNYIHDFGIWQTDAALRLFQSRGARVTHNVFERGGRCAVELWGSSCVTIEYNVFDRMMMNSTDGGSIYDNRDVDRRDIIIRHNAIINMPTTSMGEYGVYIDQDQCGIEIEGNLFYNGGAYAVMVNAGRDNRICGNAIVTTEEYKSGAAIFDNEGTDEDYRGAWEKFFASVSDPESPKARVFRERWSDIFSVDLDSNDPCDPNCWFASNNTLTGNVYVSLNGQNGVDTMNKIGTNAATVSTVENNSYYSITENPIFVNPSVGDYRIREGADFPDVEFEKIGRYDMNEGKTRTVIEKIGSGSTELEYAVRYPAGYKAGEKRPLLIFLHGSGSCGGGIGNLLANPFFDEIDKLDDFPFIVIAPHIGDVDMTWTSLMKPTSDLIKAACARDEVDSSRVYLMGTSLGGEGTWFYSARLNGLIAAAVPICGSGSLGSVKNLVNVPVWAHHGIHDDAMPYQNSVDMVEAINAAGGVAKLTSYDMGHGIGHLVYSNREVYEWLLGFSKTP